MDSEIDNTVLAYTSRAFASVSHVDLDYHFFSLHNYHVSALYLRYLSMRESTLINRWTFFASAHSLSRNAGAVLMNQGFAGTQDNAS